MTRFEQLRILKDNPWRHEVYILDVDDIPHSQGAYKTEAEARSHAQKIGGRVLDRAAPNSGDVFPTASDL